MCSLWMPLAVVDCCSIVRNRSMCSLILGSPSGSVPLFDSLWLQQGPTCSTPPGSQRRKHVFTCKFWFFNIVFTSFHCQLKLKGVEGKSYSECSCTCILYTKCPEMSSLFSPCNQDGVAASINTVLPSNRGAFISASAFVQFANHVWWNGLCFLNCAQSGTMTTLQSNWLRLPGAGNSAMLQAPASTSQLSKRHEFEGSTEESERWEVASTKNAY